MKNLIGMVEFVLEQNYNDPNEYVVNYQKVYSYAEFLKQPLELWMFVPCKLVDGVWVVLEESQIFRDIRLEEYQQVKERCLFEGLKWNVADWCDELVFEIEDGDEIYLRYNPEDNCFTDEFDIKYSTIEDLVKYKPLLTATAKKQIGL